VTNEHQLTIVVQPAGTAMTLRLAGELDLASVPILRDCLEGLDGVFGRVVLDLTELTFIDSAGLNLLVITKQRFEPQLRELVLTNPGSAVRRVLEVSGVDQILTLDGACDSTIESSATYGHA
jgi:anti-sigma B factor antagonist